MAARRKKAKTSKSKKKARKAAPKTKKVARRSSPGRKSAAKKKSAPKKKATGTTHGGRCMGGIVLRPPVHGKRRRRNVCVRRASGATF